ncbi:MAG: hypothetical protein ACFFE4_06155 [Candidatus Thorarchaeota archaeon]
MTRKAIENNAINLSQGMPDFSPPNELTMSIKEGLHKDIHQYTVIYGRTDLREKIAIKLENFSNFSNQMYLLKIED